ncbi:MAG: LacI family DNA-binding transcriptional regulator [Chloroflexota bacterium]
MSIKTVSRVINDEAYIRDTTRAKVVRAIEELGYVANVSAQRLARGRSYAIGLIYHDASWYYTTHVLRGVLESGRKAGYSIILHPFDAGRPTQYHEILQLVTQRSVDGFVFIPPADNSVPLLTKLQASKVPFVCLTPINQMCCLPFVTTTDRQGVYEMTQYLLSLGHRRIGFIKGPLNQKAGYERFAGHQAALEEFGVELDPALVMQGDDHFDSGQACAAALLNLNPPPTAIFANNDEMACGVLALAHTMGLDVPAQLSVVGFDDIPVSRQVWPALTTVRQPIRKMAELATALLIRMLEGEELTALKYEIPTELIIRDTTAPVSGM